MSSVEINFSGATGNLVQGNYIGTDATGASALPNSSIGIGIVDASNNTIGGTASGTGNTIASPVSNTTAAPRPPPSSKSI